MFVYHYSTKKTTRLNGCNLRWWSTTAQTPRSLEEQGMACNKSVIPMKMMNTMCTKEREAYINENKVAVEP